MDEPIVQRIWYLDESDRKTELVVRRGGVGYVFDNGTVRIADPALPSKTMLIPMHRVLMIEHREPETGVSGQSLLEKGGLKRLAEEATGKPRGVRG